MFAEPTRARAEARELTRRVKLGLETLATARALICIAPHELRTLQKILTADRFKAVLEFRQQILREFEKMVES